MRVLFTGSRDWTDEAAIRTVVDELPPDAVVVHGAARGADTIAGRLARQRGLVVEAHPAKWSEHGDGWCHCSMPLPAICSAAGPRRNQLMLDRGADVAHAFPLPESIGTVDMVQRLKAAGVPTTVHQRGPRLLVHTARLPNPRAKIAGYRGPNAFNVTRRGGGAAADPFAPSDALLDAGLAAKRAAKKKGATGGATEEERLTLAFALYRELYLVEMRDSYHRHHAAWRALLGRGRVVLLCYCGTAHRCHRRLLAELLVLVGKRLGVEVVDGGELGAEALG
jgi:hypothetical protein